MRDTRLIEYVARKRLETVAPEMLAALKEVVKNCVSCEDGIFDDGTWVDEEYHPNDAWCPRCGSARDAIAKIEGPEK